MMVQIDPREWDTPIDSIQPVTYVQDEHYHICGILILNSHLCIKELRQMAYTLQDGRTIY